MCRIYRFFIVFSIMALSSQAQANDPCSFIGNVQANLETKAGILGTFGNIYKSIHNLVYEPYFQDLDEDEKGIYFTRQAGFYFTLDCSTKDVDNPVEKIGMFGVGDSFKPLRKREFDGEVYYYGLRRSGLMSFVREKDLRVMDPEKVYLFNRTHDVTHFCTNKDKCSGKEKEFSARHHYAQIDLSEFKNTLSPGSCTNMKVSIFKGGKGSRRGKLFPEYKNAELKYCASTHENGVYANYYEKMRKVFDNQTISGQYLLLSSKTLRDKIPFLFTKKECQDKKVIKKKTVMSLGGSIGAGGDFSVVKLGADGKAGISYDISDEQVFELDKQYLYQNYSVTFRGIDEGQGGKKLVNDIVVVQTCDDTSTPKNLNEIVINVLPDQEALISLDIKELDKTARKNMEGVWISATSTSRVKGRTWFIASIKQQTQWRDFVFSRIYKDILSIVPDKFEKQEVIDWAFYYRDLFMATAFEYVSKDKVETIEIIDSKSYF